jgi:hypothetical protein
MRFREGYSPYSPHTDPNVTICAGGARNGGNGTVVARETSPPGRKTRWRIQGTAANDGHVRVAGWKHRTVSTKEARVALATPASLLNETIDQNHARLPGKRCQIHVSR